MTVGSYTDKVKENGRVAWIAWLSLVLGSITFVGESLLGWWTNFVDTGGWQAEAFIYPFWFTPIGVIATIVCASFAGLFGKKNRILGIVAGLLPLLGVVSMVAVASIPALQPH